MADDVTNGAADDVTDGVADGAPDDSPAEDPTHEAPPADARAADSTMTTASAPRLWPALAVYTALRIGLIVVLTVLIMLAGSPVGMPLIVALAFAVVLQLPLSVLLFPKQRRTLTAALAHAKADRNAERDRLRAALTGEEPLD